MFWMKVKLIQGAAGVKNVFTQIQLVCQLYPFLALYDLYTIICYVQNGLLQCTILGAILEEFLEAAASTELCGQVAAKGQLLGSCDPNITAIALASNPPMSPIQGAGFDN